MKHYPIVKEQAYAWRCYFRPRWKVLDAREDSYLWHAYFWTRHGAESALKEFKKQTVERKLK